MKLTGHTEPYAVLGHPIGHTLSPAMHNASFAALGLDAVYLAFDVAPDRLLSVLPAMAEMGFRGINLTVPLKETAFAGLEDLDASARRFRAVNTVQIRDGRLIGHNTDGAGFLMALEEAFGRGPHGAKVFVLGCGGAGRAVALTCAGAGIEELVLTDLDEPRAGRVADEVRAVAPGLPVRVVPPVPASWEYGARAADLVVQCTPVGMKPTDAPLLGPAAFRSGTMAFDLVYMYPETPFMKAARTAGAQAANGLGMLLHQGARAFTIWTGSTADLGAMRQALEAAVYR